MPQFNNVSRWLLGAALLLGFDLAGRSLGAALALPVPGPVLGMLLLLMALMLYGRVPTALARVSEQILRYLVLIFLPACVGVFFVRDLSGGDWLALVVAMVVGTLISFVVTALLLQRLIQRGERRAASATRAGEERHHGE